MQETRQGSVTLVLGGVRSGKSRYAQQLDRKSTRLNSSHNQRSRMPSSA